MNSLLCLDSQTGFPCEASSTTTVVNDIGGNCFSRSGFLRRVWLLGLVVGRL